MWYRQFFGKDFFPKVHANPERLAAVKYKEFWLGQSPMSKAADKKPFSCWNRIIRRSMLSLEVMLVIRCEVGTKAFGIETAATFFGLDGNRLSQSKPLAFLAKHTPGHLQHHLEPFSSASRVLSESFNAGLFDLGADLLPPTAEGNNLGFLFELGLSLGIGH